MGDDNIFSVYLLKRKVRYRGSCLQAPGGLGSAARTEHDFACKFRSVLLPFTHLGRCGWRLRWAWVAGEGSARELRDHRLLLQGGPRQNWRRQPERDMHPSGKNAQILFLLLLLFFGFPCDQHLSDAEHSTRRRRLSLLRRAASIFLQRLQRPSRKPDQPFSWL